MIMFGIVDGCERISRSALLWFLEAIFDVSLYINCRDIDGGDDAPTTHIYMHANEI